MSRPDAVTARPRGTTFRHAVVIGLVVLAAYANACLGPFQFDDYNVIVQYPPVHSWSAWLDEIDSGLRPVLKLSYTLNWTLGTGAVGFHLFNVFVHLVNALLVYTLTRHTAVRLAPGQMASPGLLALFTALLFAAHPVQTEAVTYISGRSVSLMSVFYLGSVLAYIRGMELGKWIWSHLISPLLFILAVGTKEIAVTLPAALLLWELSCTDRLNRRVASRLVARQWVHWSVLAGLFAALILHPAHGSHLLGGFGIRSVVANLLSEIHGVAYLASRLIVFWRLNIDPALPVITSPSPGLALEGLILATGLISGIWLLRARPWAGLGILWFFLHLLPTNSFVPRLDIANERQLYLADWGIFVAAVFTVAYAAQRLPPLRLALTGVGVALICIFIAFTANRNQTYRSEISLWEDVVSKAPGNARAYNNLGYAYMLAGRDEAARQAFLDALRLRPDYRPARRNLDMLPDPDGEDP